MKFFLSALLLCTCLITKAARIDSVDIYSHSMKKSFKAIVIKPSAYENVPDSHFPVVYLLHGWSGNYSNWYSKVYRLTELAELYNFIIVCPDGGYGSWYFDSPIDSSLRYETYISTEVPNYIDTHYKTVQKREYRAITGLSMGGHGSLFIAFRHSKFFGACGSMSGGMDLDAAHNKYDIMKTLGDSIKHAGNWKKYSMINIVNSYPWKDSLAIIFDCGVDDSFIKGNRVLHEKMLQLKIPHDYIERPGGHSWNYWGNAVEYQLLYFYHYFQDHAELMIMK
jgi:S-formylglutathione hydrolase FrmB